MRENDTIVVYDEVVIELARISLALCEASSRLDAISSNLMNKVYSKHQRKKQNE